LPEQFFPLDFIAGLPERAEFSMALITGAGIGACRMANEQYRIHF